MSDEHTTLKSAIAEWKKSHHISDNDPVIAIADLLDIHLSHRRSVIVSDQQKPIGFEEFRNVLEELNGSTHDFKKTANRLIAELRKRPASNANHAPTWHIVAIFVVALLAFASGAYFGNPVAP